MSGGGGLPLRVLIVCHYFPPHVGGIENVAHQQAVRLARTGVDVTVLTSGSTVDGTAVPDEDGLRVVRVPAWNALERRLGVPFPLFSPVLLREARRWARWADVVHVHDSFYLSSWAAGLAAAVARTPLVMTQHVAMVDHSVALVRWTQRAVYATAGRWLLRRSRRTAVLNASVASFVRGLGAPGDAVVHLPNGVDGEVFRPVASLAEKAAARRRWGLPADVPLVLFVGRPVGKKGYDILLGAASAEYELVFAGEKPAHAVAREGVHHLGPMGAAELAGVYRACDIFALPSTAEGFPLTVQEAMASGLPVVTTDDAGYAPYQLDRSRLALVQRAPDAVRAVLRQLAVDADRRATMSAYSLAYSAEHFSWPAHVELLRRLYDDARGTAPVHPETAR
ncbi:MAG TPA: glycosyltransferase family 4 protein [Mycobacteriales bacterium]